MSGFVDRIEPHLMNQFNACRRKYPYCSEEKEKESGEYLESLSS